MNSELSTSPFQTSAPPLTNSLSPPTSSLPSTNSNGILGIPLIGWLLIILILAILGINIFTYFAKGFDFTSGIIGKIISTIGIDSQKVVNAVASGTQQAVDVAITGTKTAVSATSNTVNKGLDYTDQLVQDASASTSLQNSEPVQSKSTPPTQPQINSYQQTSLNKTLNSAKPEEPSSYNADESNSTIQGKKTNQVGWCYIGEERGYRSCSQVGQDDVCMSGNIFPSKDICVNPSLRP
jgi:hypothetical protein